MISLENVNKFYHKGKKNQIHVIDNTNLTLPDNGLVALLGNSGSGKTTLLNVIGGLDKVKKGNIYINGKKITSKCNYKVDKIRNISIGYIFQDYKLINDLSVYDNVAIVLKMIGLKNKNDIKKRVEFILDRLGMLRYKKRPASMLSGGEKQRVAIARAIVKDPDVILADEPTGNLDSKNSIEIMNIIKAISKNKLVILVTHEQELAHFYADRIINIQDGKIVEDNLNKNVNNLNYQIDNVFYLKDFEYIEKLDNGKVYSTKKEKLNLDIVFRNGNIYIRNNGNEKIEVVDSESNIEFIDDHYKGMNKNDIDNYNFTYSLDIKKKYLSICNIFVSIKQAFNKIIDYTTLKKLLLLGFLISGCFIMYAISTMFAAQEIKDEDFIEYNRNYLYANIKKLKVNDMLEYEKMDNINYILPGNSLIGFEYIANNYYQTSLSTITFNGSLSSIDMIDEKDIIYGTMPTNDHEIVIDKLVIQRNINNDSNALMVGIKSANDLVGKEISIGTSKYIITGITDLISPSIYVKNNQFINILYNYYNNMKNFSNLLDYELVDSIELKQGRYPTNDYETIINISEKDNYKLNKQISDEVNGHKLTVVGYYYSNINLQNYLVNNNTIKYNLINNVKDFVVYSNNPKKTIELFRKYNINIEDSYEIAKNNYKVMQSESVKSTVIVSYIIIGISLIEMFLMMRSSFLSRIKEIGIYRSIGVKKIDIYKMFIGEIIVITSLTSIPGILLSSYFISILKKIKYFNSLFMLNLGVIFISIAIVFVFNLLVGLIPVFNVLKKKPAIILSRHDLD